MPLTFYNHSDRIVRDSTLAVGKFAHTQGGTLASHGITIPELRTPFHLLFDLDLRDPSIDIMIPNLETLPLLYGLHYMGTTSDQVYKVGPNRVITVLRHRELTADFDYDQPDSFPECNLAFETRQLDLSTAEDALSMLQVFGLDDLNESELNKALDIAYDDWSGLEVLEDWVVFKDLTRREYLEFWGSPPFWQPGGFSDRCDNPNCPSVKYNRHGWLPFPVRGRLRTLLRRQDWQFAPDVTQTSTLRIIASCEWDGILLVFRFCDACHCVHVTNQAD